MTRLLALFLLALPAEAAEHSFRIRIDLAADASAHLLAEGLWMSVEAGYYGEALPGSVAPCVVRVSASWVMEPLASGLVPKARCPPHSSGGNEAEGWAAACRPRSQT